MQRLELTWIGKDQEPRLEPRILLENPELRSGRPGPDGNWQGMLIHGDNLLALKALEAEFTGKIKCIYIDPPYNTGSAFEHYDDGIEHSLWLSLIRDRLKILRNLLADDGSIWISIDDNECHYLKVVCDEVFGRGNFVASIIWEKADSPRNSARQFSTDHDYILVYSRCPDWQPAKLPRTEEANSIYSNPDDDERGPWLPGDPYANKPYSKGLYTIEGPTGRKFSPPPGRYWRISEEKLRELDNDDRIWWGTKGDARPSIKRYLTEVSDLVPRTLWRKDDVGSNRTSKNEMRILFAGETSFDTPKPELLVHRILHIATNPNDLVLDSFLGSGTTAAVAHKMGRRWIGIELGEHAYTHCVPRLQKVVRGEDQGGISKAVGWRGSGGFRVFALAPTLLREDRFGQLVINPDYNAPMLAAAVCRHEGFRYEPDPLLWWKQGRGAGRDYLLATTQHVTRPLLDAIREDLLEGETLLICCRAFDKACASAYPDITLRKIPNMLFSRCEWGRDDYSLHIVPQPGEELAAGDTPAWPVPEPEEMPHKSGKKATLNPSQGELF
ncbi:MAG: site-specific DNA-methyltransferase [Saprospiraceae bacterium]|nr:site-specific DNA-methyltransferase [Saprospiraceae bacterium]